MISPTNSLAPGNTGRGFEARIWRAAISTALATGLLTGCAMSGGAHPSQFAGRAEAALDKGDASKAVSLAEQAVAADPANAAYRATLGDAYLRAGRFASARQAYDEAMQLGDDKGRTALSLALADIAQGNNQHAMDTLAAYRDSIPAADYGLAVALAGQPAQGVAVLGNLLRSGENSVKVRQNLAYAYALGGMWAQARVMASQDVPADKIGQRLTEWAMNNRPEDGNKRVAMLLNVPVVADRGEPQALALANTPTTGQLAADAAKRADAPQLAAAAQQELPALDGSASAPVRPAVQVAQAADPAPQPVHTAPAALATIDLPPSETRAPEPVQAASYRVAGESVAARTATPAPAARDIPVRSAPARIAPVRTASAAPATHGTHLVQLGAFSSAEGANRAWTHFARRNPALGNYTHVTTRVVIGGREYWRVMVAGLGSYGSASALCGRVRHSGGACFVRLDAEKVKGQPETRMARR